jgi:hypothetical protein
MPRSPSPAPGKLLISKQKIASEMAVMMVARRGRIGYKMAAKIRVRNPQS